MLVWPSFCASCGHGLRREDKFCSNCGAPVPQQPFESTATMAKPVLRVASADNQAPQAAPPQRVEEVVPVAEPRPAEEPRLIADTLPLRPEPDLPVAPREVPTAFDYVEPLPTAYDKVVPEVVEKPRRKSRPPVLEILVIILLLVGAAAAVWMLRSSMPRKATAVPSNVDVTLSPATARVAAGRAVDLAATVSGTDDVEVEWSVQEGDDGGRVVPRGAKAAAGNVSSLAVYIAPDKAGTYHVVATSKADPQKSAAAEITVKAGK